MEMTGHGMGTDTLAFFLLHAPTSPQGFRLTPSGLCCSCSQSQQSSLICQWYGCSVLLGPLRSSEVDGAGFAFLQRLRPLIGLVWVLENNLICLPLSLNSLIQAKAWCELGKHPTNSALFPSPSASQLTPWLCHWGGTRRQALDPGQKMSLLSPCVHDNGKLFGGLPYCKKSTMHSVQAQSFLGS